MIKRIDHVAIAVRDYDAAQKFFTRLFGAIKGSCGSEPSMRYFWQNFAIGDLSRFEILTPTASGSFLDNFLKDREGGVHHITMQTPDIRAAKDRLEAEGIPYFGYYESEFGCWNELFIHPRDAFGVLIQIAEFEADDWIAEKVRMPEGKKFEVRSGDTGVVLQVKNPGGGICTLELSKKEARSLAAQLNEQSV